MEVIECESVENIISWAKSIGRSPQASDYDPYSKVIYRGHADEKWDLCPSAFRLPITAEVESKLLDEFFRQQSAFLTVTVEPHNLLDRLTLAQHFKLPTRLLDWTESVLVATYFAIDPELHKRRPAICDPEFQNHKPAICDSDACIWAFNAKELTYYNTPYNDSNSLTMEEVRDYLIKLAFEAPKYQILEGKKELEDQVLNRIAWFRPRIIDRRMLVQKSWFTIFDRHVQNEADGQTAIFQSALHKAIIRKKHIATIRNELRFLGIDRLSVYPDADSLGMELMHKFNDTKNVG